MEDLLMKTLQMRIFTTCMLKPHGGSAQDICALPPCGFNGYCSLNSRQNLIVVIINVSSLSCVQHISFLKYLHSALIERSEPFKYPINKLVPRIKFKRSLLLATL